MYDIETEDEVEMFVSTVCRNGKSKNENDEEEDVAVVALEE